MDFYFINMSLLININVDINYFLYYLLMILIVYIYFKIFLLILEYSLIDFHNICFMILIFCYYYF